MAIQKFEHIVTTKETVYRFPLYYVFVSMKNTYLIGGSDDDKNDFDLMYENLVEDNQIQLRNCIVDILNIYYNRSNIIDYTQVYKPQNLDQQMLVECTNPDSTVINPILKVTITETLKEDK